MIESKTGVMRAIIEPMRERWTPPAGANPDALIGDMVADLKGFEESVLRQVFEVVRRNHHYNNWPRAGEFLTAARELTKDDLPPPSDADADAAYTRKRREWAQEQLLQHWSQAWNEGWVSLARDWLSGPGYGESFSKWPIHNWKALIRRRAWATGEIKGDVGKAV